MQEERLQPPPAPRKAHVRKMIKVSSRVRRKLNFDFAVDVNQPVTKRKCLQFISSDNSIENIKRSSYFRPIEIQLQINEDAAIRDSNYTPIQTPLIKTVTCKKLYVNGDIEMANEANENKLLPEGISLIPWTHVKQRER